MDNNKINLFGRSLNLIGDGKSDLVLNTKGKVRIKINSKFIDLFDGNKIKGGSDLEFIFNGESVGKDPGIWILNNGEVWIKPKEGNSINLKSDISGNFVSYTEEQEVTPELKLQALINIGFFCRTYSDIDESLNGLVYVLEDNLLYIVNEGSITPFIISSSNIEKTEEEKKKEEDNETLLSYLSYDGNTVTINNNIKITTYDVTIPDHLYCNTITSENGTSDQGFMLISAGNKAILYVDQIKVRDGIESTFNPVIFPEFYFSKVNIIDNIDEIRVSYNKYRNGVLIEEEFPEIGIVEDPDYNDEENFDETPEESEELTYEFIKGDYLISLKNISEYEIGDLIGFNITREIDSGEQLYDDEGEPIVDANGNPVTKIITETKLISFEIIDKFDSTIESTYVSPVYEYNEDGSVKIENGHFVISQKGYTETKLVEDSIEQNEFQIKIVSDILLTNNLLSGTPIFLLKRGDLNGLKISNCNLDITDETSIFGRIGNLSELEKTISVTDENLTEESITEELIEGSGIYSNQIYADKAAYVKEYELDESDNSSRFASTEWVRKVCNTTSNNPVVLFSGILKHSNPVFESDYWGPEDNKFVYHENVSDLQVYFGQYKSKNVYYIEITVIPKEDYRINLYSMSASMIKTFSTTLDLNDDLDGYFSNYNISGGVKDNKVYLIINDGNYRYYNTNAYEGVRTINLTIFGTVKKLT